MRGASGRLMSTLLLALTCLIAPAAQAPQKIDTSTIGPQVGDRIPAFAGTDQFGKPHSFPAAAGPKGLMLVFFRSADW